MKGWKRAALFGLLAIAFAIGAIAYLWPEEAKRVAEKPGPAQDRTAFDRWLADSERNRRDFAAFHTFLAEQGVADVVPSWQLTRADSSIAAYCSGGAFVVPPRALWGNAVPVLRFVRERIVPKVGAVEAISSWRSPRANACSRGAKGSKHLNFSGIDFVAADRPEPVWLFGTLCDLHRELGPASRFGLGAYFDPAKPERNRDGRFHVDLAGHRSWGFGYGGAASGCRKL